MAMSRDDTKRYPYLLAAATVQSSPSTGTSGANQLEEDVDMDDERVDAHARPGLARPTYLAIDTNIFLDKLRLVKALHTFLSTTLAGCILVPSAVINELDSLSKSDIVAGVSPEGDVHLSDLARVATAWLLQVARKPKEERVIRCQKWSERLDTELRKGDDKILDCCLFFAREAKVSLWTNDQNLSLLHSS
ncbi:PIN domain-domain-containing protein [Kockovaella imperatae]|uniref:PIN domain-domain-containing protein n=1 Tax=Kockovaella imperatae TaxID=4999 RepID=A0A1Y1UF85_9TREE|nr:PIN domain-domain-containing protein [Kockovaella imperatae]ORX36731.1 PIN domain-domain-containing protein [Kockovaella imperatae]